ncbi:MAG TPA: NAD(P)-dependent oxidoreductase [Candidatus Nitrosocosmicus sp.]|nr:NAD(P)-dependent oxidoreductase [Candidatus Nitrosocosmicus sp.]
MSLKSDMAIGVIGVGMLGTGIIERLIGLGTTVSVYGRNKVKLAYFQAKGAQTFNDAQTLAEKSDIIITCVTNFESLKEILFQDNGVMKCSNKKLIIADCTTVNSNQSLYCSNLVGERDGFAFLSTPVMGGPNDAKKGELISLVSGNENSFKEIRHVLEKISKHVFYVGPVNGVSNSIKLALNLNIAIITLSLSEGLILAKHSGIDLNLYLQILNLTKLKTGISERKGQMMLNNDYSPSFFLKNMLKDIDLMMDASQDLRLFLPMTSLSQQLFRAANNSNDRKNKDYSVIYQFLEELNSK